MNHAYAAELATGGWHYVSSNRRTGTHPVGFCAEHEPHATEDEARRCYSEYRRTRIRLSIAGSPDEQLRCRCCSAWTQSYAALGAYEIAYLCAEHMTVDAAAECFNLNGPAGDSWYT